MPTLAPKLPWQHPFAGGYPRRGGQPLPTDPDAIDYLNRVAAADGASVEVGIAQAIDAFVRGCKADSAGYAGDPTRSNWDAIKAACIMCGARTLSGALVPLSVDYGPELVDIENLPTPLISDAGTSGEWDAASRTMSNNDPASDSRGSYPRYSFSYAGSGGKRWLVTGRLTGDTANVNAILFGTIPVSYNAATGEFSGVVVAAGGWLEIQCRTDVARVFSVTIEELSIRQDRSTPTAYNFTSSNYNRETGLVGDGSTKYLDSNRANNADGQDDKHLAVYSTSTQVGGNVMFAGVASGGNATRIYKQSVEAWLTYDGSTGAFSTPITNASLVGLVGLTRSGSSSFSARIAGTAAGATTPSVAFGPLNHFVFGQNSSGSANSLTSSRLAFYSIGSSLSLSALDARVSTLVSQIAAAIP